MLYRGCLHFISETVQKVFCKKRVLKNFARKLLCRRLFLMLEDCSFIYNYLYETSRNETHSRNKISFQVICVYVLCTHFLEMKHLRKLLFYQNKDSRSKDQNKNEIHFIFPCQKTIINRIFPTEKHFHFESPVNTLSVRAFTVISSDCRKESWLSLFL